MSPRRYNSFFINSSIESDREEYYNYRVNIYFNNYKNKLDANDDTTIYFHSIKQDIEESKFALSLGGDYRYEGIDFSGDILFYNNSYSGLESQLRYDEYDYPFNPEYAEGIRTTLYDIKKNSFIFGLFGSGSAQLSNNFFASAGFKFYIYNYLYSLTRNKDISKGSVLPQLSLRYENRNNFSLSLFFSPDLKIMDFEQLFKLNPFALYREMNHVLTPINLFLRLDISAIKNLRILADIGYLEEKNTTYFIYDYYDATRLVYYYQNYSSWFFDAAAKGMYSNLKIEYNIDKFNAIALDLNYQNKSLDSLSLRVPFVPQIRASLNYHLFLYDNKLKINPSIDFIGDRVSYTLNNTYPYSYEWVFDEYQYPPLDYMIEKKEKTTALVNLDAEYLIIKNLIANLTITNMFNTKYSYYYDYQEYPFSIFVGLKFIF
jgi:hypothetical protein